MEQEAYLNFLGTWNLIMWGLAALSVLVALVIILGYYMRLSSLKSLKAKFDLASEKEVSKLLAGNFSIAAGIFFIANTASESTVALSIFWFFIRIFIALCFGTLYGYVAYLIFNYYYPKRLHKKLHRLRYTPRVNPQTGNQMKLLSEEEEDAYLDEGMQAEENVFSVDYDVWIDEESGETTIEKYKGHLSALECDRCGFQTLRLSKEEVIHAATDTVDGELEKEYKCTYCGRIRRKTVKIKAQIDPEKAGELVTDVLGQDNKIETVKVEIHDSQGEIKSYEFPNLEQASNFLGEFDLQKVSKEEQSF